MGLKLLKDSVMNKLLSALLTSALLFSALTAFPGNARAVEVKASGVMEIMGETTHNIRPGNTFQDAADNGSRQKHFAAVQKLVLALDFTVSERLSAHYAAQVGAFTWGGPTGDVYNMGSGNREESAGGALGSRAANIVTREAYLDWTLPDAAIKIRMGQQWFALPGYAFPNAVLGQRGTGIAVSAPIAEAVRVNAFWLRAYSDSRRGLSTATRNLDDNLDLFSLTASYRGDGFQAAPWLMAGKLGGDVINVNNPFNTVYVTSGLLPVTGYNVYGHAADGGAILRGAAPSNSTLLFTGLALQVTAFDPLRLALDALWSAADNSHRSTGRSGWYVGASAEYKTAYGVPTFKAWFASGDNGNPVDGSERPLSVRSGFTPGASVLFNTFAYGIADTCNRGEVGGSWGVSAQWNELSLFPHLFHSLRATYARGTNSPAMARYAAKLHSPLDPPKYLTTRDSAVEIDLDTTWSIYKNLAAMLELSYVFQDFDGKVWKNLSRDGNGTPFSNAWRAGLTFTYEF